MTNRSRFIPLFILSAMLAICPTTALLNLTWFHGSSISAWGSLLAVMLVVISLLLILIASGLWGDLIRGTTEQTSGMRDVGVLAAIASGVLVGALIVTIIAALAMMLPAD